MLKSQSLLQKIGLDLRSISEPAIKNDKIIFSHKAEL